MSKGLMVQNVREEEHEAGYDSAALRLGGQDEQVWNCRVF